MRRRCCHRPLQNYSISSRRCHEVDCEVGRLRELLSSERETALGSLRESQQHRLALQQQVRDLGMPV